MKVTFTPGSQTIFALRMTGVSTPGDFKDDNSRERHVFQCDNPNSSSMFASCSISQETMVDQRVSERNGLITDLFVWQELAKYTCESTDMSLLCDGSLLI